MGTAFTMIWPLICCAIALVAVAYDCPFAAAVWGFNAGLSLADLIDLANSPYADPISEARRERSE